MTVKTLRCAECHRPLLRFAASIKTRNGLIGWGPTCAKVFGRVMNEPKPERSAVKRDKRTIDWVAEVK